MYYGENTITRRWLDCLYQQEENRALCTSFCSALVKIRSRFAYSDLLPDILRDKKTLVRTVAYSRYEKEHQEGGLTSGIDFWITEYQYYRVETRDVSPAAPEKQKKQH